MEKNIMRLTQEVEIEVPWEQVGQLLAEADNLEQASCLSEFACAIDRLPRHDGQYQICQLAKALDETTVSMLTDLLAYRFNTEAMSAEGGAMPSMTEKRALVIADDHDCTAGEADAALMFLAGRVRSLTITNQVLRERTPSPEVQRVLTSAKAWATSDVWDVGGSSVVKELQQAVAALAARERA